MSYFDCYLIPIPSTKVEKYKEFSKEIATVYREYGAVRVVDCILDTSVVDGTQFHAEAAQAQVQAAALRNFPDAAAAKQGEIVVLSWTEWASKSARDEFLPRVLADPRVQPKDDEEIIFEGSRLVAGGFFKLIET